MKAKQILNIGLNVGQSEPTTQLAKTLELLNALTTFGHKIVDGSYTTNGITIIERCLVVYVTGKILQSDEIGFVCTALQQDCISVANTAMVYPESHKGEKIGFNSEYFNL